MADTAVGAPGVPWAAGSQKCIGNSAHFLRRPVSRRCCEPVKIQHPALSVDKPYSQQEKEHARNVGQQINQAVINGTALPFEHDQDTAADGGYLDGNINVKKIPGKKDEHD